MHAILILCSLRALRWDSGGAYVRVEGYGIRAAADGKRAMDCVLAGSCGGLNQWRLCTGARAVPLLRCTDS